MSRILVTTTILLLTVFAASQADAQILKSSQRTKPTELRPLEDFVGYWSSEAKSAATQANGNNEQKFTGKGQASWILDGWFLENIEVATDSETNEVVKSLYIRTFDPDERKYVTWSFHSNGKSMKWSGTRNIVDGRFSSTPNDLPDGMIGTVLEWFPENNTTPVAGSLTLEKTEGDEKLFELNWKKNRVETLSPEWQKVASTWAKIDTPKMAPAEELTKLQPFIGSWKSAYVNYSEKPADGQTISATTSARWILDGHFLLGTTRMKDNRQIWIAGYNTEAKQYSFIRFTDTGRVGESTGEWNEQTKSFVWIRTDTDDGNHVATNRIVSDDVIQCHMVGTDPIGNVELDLILRMTRQK